MVVTISHIFIVVALDRLRQIFGRIVAATPEFLLWFCYKIYIFIVSIRFNPIGGKCSLYTIF